MKNSKRPSVLGRLFRVLLVISGGATLSATLFLVLPMIQAISEGPGADRELRQVDTAEAEPPPPLEEEEEPPEPEEEDTPEPELAEDSQPLDLSQMEISLNPAGGGSGWLGGNVGMKLTAAGSKTGDVDALFSLSDLDQKPRPIYQVSPVVDSAMRKKAPATVYVLFIVDQQGRVDDAKVQKSSNPLFDKSALAAVKKWKFEPGKRSGKPVRFRMRVPISFPEGS